MLMHTMGGTLLLCLLVGAAQDLGNAVDEGGSTRGR